MLNFHEAKNKKVKNFFQRQTVKLKTALRQIANGRLVGGEREYLIYFHCIFRDFLLVFIMFSDNELNS